MKKTTKIGALAAGLASLLILSGCAASFTLFEDVAADCGGAGIDVQDEGTTLTVDMMGEEEYAGASYDEVECIVDGVGTPSYIKDSMWATTALAGRQSDDFKTDDGAVIEVSWSYHPDNGMDIVYHKSDD